MQVKCVCNKFGKSLLSSRKQ